MKKLLWLYVVILVLGFYNVASAVEIAIKWIDNGRGNFEIGDIVAVKENGENWGGVDPRINPESSLVIVQITDMTYAELTELGWARSVFDETDPDNRVRLLKRKSKIDKDGKIPNNIINYIKNNNGFIVTDTATVTNWITHKAQ